MSSNDPLKTEDYLVCSTCGTQFPTIDRSSLKTCFICDDPRQYTPPSGQSFTTLAALRGKHKNVFHPLPSAPETFTSIVSEPKLAIGQRAILVRTPRGNILWDCVTLLDLATISKIRELGGLRAIVISHPHYYSTHVEWAQAFGCPVYLAAEDRRWVARESEHQVFLSEREFDVPIDGEPSGVKALKLGGHFPGSLVVLHKSHLLVADTLMTTPAGLGNWEVDGLGEAREGGRPEGLNSYSFMWSIPNMIPLAPDVIERMWQVLKNHRFKSSHGAFLGTDIVGKVEEEMRRRVLESMQIQIGNMGYTEHPLLGEN
ncbi:beta-lactamase-like protein [Truncatella angustata]|uniref:Beta-lactamase-like protein n=1 Tax=Truncatella angustata TaxID=152316 RepID=A0A9P8URU9_9PEZI|nr:beta-lactamase-like protein [Truncatella angustata]KAH6657161.1 beta-lactamase-like protein [Truncatella angustata]KAH8197601.1 hypothetical protein TruAng_008233 [Truncatella angustata]